MVFVLLLLLLLVSIVCLAGAVGATCLARTQLCQATNDITFTALLTQAGKWYAEGIPCMQMTVSFVS